MWNNFFKHIDIDPANAHILDGNAQNLEEECQAYEQKIAEAGGIELFVGGQTCGFWYRLHSSAAWYANYLWKCCDCRLWLFHYIIIIIVVSISAQVEWRFSVGILLI